MHRGSYSWQQMAKSLRCRRQGFGNKLCWLDQGLHPSPALFPFLPRLFFSPRGAKATCFCSRRTGGPPGVIKHSHQPSRWICQQDLLSSSLSEHSNFQGWSHQKQEVTSFSEGHIPSPFSPDLAPAGSHKFQVNCRQDNQSFCRDAG